MKAFVLATLVVAALTGFASAGQKDSPPDDSAYHVVDLADYGGPVVYLYCDHATTLSNCESPRFYQETNGLENLQHLGLKSGAKEYPRDQPLGL